ncbi:unnamed protein product, partial [Ceratitis capitata]
KKCTLIFNITTTYVTQTHHIDRIPVIYCFAVEWIALVLSFSCWGATCVSGRICSAIAHRKSAKLQQQTITTTTATTTTPTNTAIIETATSATAKEIM